MLKEKSPKVKVLNPLFEAYFKDSMSDGFPQTTMKNQLKDAQDKVPPQDGIPQHLIDCTGAKTEIMHPKRQKHKTEDSWSCEN